MSSVSDGDDYNAHIFGWFVSIGIFLFGTLYRYGANWRRRHLPPLSTTGYWKTLRILNSGEAPWWMLQQSRSISSIYRLNLLVPGTHTIVVGDGPTARQILRDQAQVKPYLVYSGFNRVLGGWNIVTSNGTMWKHARKGTAPAFSKAAVEQMSQVLDEKLTEWMNNQKEDHDSSCFVFDVAETMVHLTTAAMAQAAMEYEISHAEIVQFQLDLEMVLKEYLRHQVGNPLRAVPIFGSILFPNVRKAHQAAQRLQNLASRMLKQCYHKESASQPSSTSNIKNSNKKKNKKSLIACIANNPHYRSDAERVSDILTFLVAGHDTTAYSIAWTLIELARHSDYQTQLRTQLLLQRQRQRDGGDVSSLTSSPSPMFLLQNIVKESLRLHPVAAMGSVRQMAHTMSIPDTTTTSTTRIIIPKGATVFVHLLSIHRDPKYFSLPDEFLPYRWAEQKKNNQSESSSSNHNNMTSKKSSTINDDADADDDPSLHPRLQSSSSYLPFSLGSRNCIGQGLAMQNLTCAISKLVMQFEFTLDQPGSIDHFLTLKPVGTILRARPIRPTSWSC